MTKATLGRGARQAGVTALIIASTSFDVAYHRDQTLPIVAFVLAMAFTLVISRRAQREGRARRTAGSRLGAQPV